MRCLAAAFALGLFALSTEAAEPPIITIERNALTLSRLPAVLDDEAVTPHLRTGLTTVLLFTVESRAPSRQNGAAHAAVRYDLWDEVYRIELTSRASGHRSAHVDIPAPGDSTAPLREWWRTLALPVLPTEGHWQAPVVKARVTLQLLPFSQAEQRDAQQWLLRSFRSASPPPANGAPQSPLQGSERFPAAPVREFYGAMLAASMGQRDVIRWSWTVPVRQETR